MYKLRSGLSISGVQLCPFSVNSRGENGRQGRRVNSLPVIRGISPVPFAVLSWLHTKGFTCRIELQKTFCSSFAWQEVKGAVSGGSKCVHTHAKTHTHTYIQTHTNTHTYQGNKKTSKANICVFSDSKEFLGARYLESNNEIFTGCKAWGNVLSQFLPRGTMASVSSEWRCCRPLVGLCGQPQSPG